MAIRAIFVGAFFGAGVAFLFAPVSGRRARAFLKERFERLSHESNDFIGDKRRQFTTTVEYTRSKAYRVREELDDQMQAVAGR